MLICGMEIKAVKEMPPDMAMVIKDGEISLWDADGTKVQKYRVVKWPDGSMSLKEIEKPETRLPLETVSRILP